MFAVFGFATIAFAMFSTSGDADAQQACDPNYANVCLKVYTGVDDVNCGDIPFSQIPVVGTDVYNLDLDGDGFGCDNSNPTPVPWTATPTRTNTPVTPAATATTA